MLRAAHERMARRVEAHEAQVVEAAPGDSRAKTVARCLGGDVEDGLPHDLAPVRKSLPGFDRIRRPTPLDLSAQHVKALRACSSVRISRFALSSNALEFLRSRPIRCAHNQEIADCTSSLLWNELLKCMSENAHQLFFRAVVGSGDRANARDPRDVCASRLLHQYLSNICSHSQRERFPTWAY